MNEPTEDPRTDPVGVSDGGAASTASTANSGGAGGGGPTGGPSSGPVAEWADTFAADWPKKAADAVDLVVDNVHDRVIRPVMLGARAVVFGLLVGVIAVTFVVLFCIMALRFLDAYVSNGHVWISYFILGGLFTVGGFACWYFRTRGGAAATGS